jgi:signal transduction histidine kinase
MQPKAYRSRTAGWILPLVLPLLLLLGSAFSLASQKRAGDLLLHTDEARVSINRLRSALIDIETGHRGYLVTDDARFLEPYESGMRAWPSELERIRELTRDNPGQLERVAELESLIRERLELQSDTRRAHDAGELERRDLWPHMVREKNVMDDVRESLIEVESEELRLGYEQQRERGSRFGRTFVLLGGSVASLVFVAAGARRQKADADARRRQSEERLALLGQVERERVELHSLLMQTPAPIAVLRGSDLRVMLWNQAYADLTGNRELRGRPLEEIDPSIRSSGLLEAITASYRSGKPHTLVEQEACAADRQHPQRYFTSSFQPTRNRDDEVTGVIGIGVEVTEQVRARKMLEASLHFYEHFISILGHDLRNPLNAIVMATTLLSTRPGSNCDPATLARIFRSSERIARMIDQILDLARSRLAGGIPLERTSTDLAATVTAVVDELQSAHPDRTIAWTPRPIVHGHWDGGRLTQVVRTLVENALEHSVPNQAVRLRIDERCESVELRVQSFGPPIDPDVLAIIFDPYRRGARTQKSQGLGVGLFICQQIALAHGGTLTATSSEADGTLFVLCLPRPSPADLRSLRQ